MSSVYRHLQRIPAALNRLVPLGTCVVLWLTWVGTSLAARPEPDPKAGEAAYQQHCARCHGVAGKGDGVDARRFYPRPRDLSLGVYKFRSTASGTPPSDEDLFRILTDGLPGSNMPDWRHLDEPTRWQLVAYLKSLAPIFTDAAPEPVAVSGDPGLAKADLAAGRAVYEKLGCAACHGALGRGDGPSAATLVDDWGMPIRPRNLAQGWGYRGGGEARAIFLRLMAGIDGAGMPSYQGAVSPEEAWHLAYYVASLQEPARWHPIVRAAFVRGPLPKTAEDPQWQAAEVTDLALRHVVTPEGAWTSPPTVTMVSLRALYNEEAVALQAQWDDPTHEAQPPGDALAVVLQPQGLAGDVATLQAWPASGAPSLDVCYWSAEGPHAHEAVVPDYEAVRREGPGRVPLISQARYNEGRWHVVLVRPRRPAEPSGAHLIGPGASLPVAVAVWDGGMAEARAVSPWIDVRFDADRATARHE
ncbi:MAG: c-type cytochrome [Candidatus Omnitrophica bacterium]|nr:c-type cytochrome [Candidatus Omnitrophota bacterium]